MVVGTFSVEIGDERTTAVNIKSSQTPIAIEPAASPLEPAAVSHWLPASRRKPLAVSPPK